MTACILLQLSPSTIGSPIQPSEDRQILFSSRNNYSSVDIPEAAPSVGTTNTTDTTDTTEPISGDDVYTIEVQPPPYEDRGNDQTTDPKLTHPPSYSLSQEQYSVDDSLF